MLKTVEFELPDAEITYFPGFIDEEDAWNLFETLLQHTRWQHDDITVFGKTYKQPRLTAFFASNLAPYTYSNITMHPKPYPDELLQLKERLNKLAKTEFSSCLLNLYRDGQDSNGWHADDEQSLGKNPVIASISLGAERKFKLKHKKNPELKQDIMLEHGSLLLMKGPTQHHWLHQIPKTRKQVGKRINLTFRLIK